MAAMFGRQLARPSCLSMPGVWARETGGRKAMLFTSEKKLQGVGPSHSPSTLAYKWCCNEMQNISCHHLYTDILGSYLGVSRRPSPVQIRMHLLFWPAHLYSELFPSTSKMNNLLEKHFMLLEKLQTYIQATDISLRKKYSPWGM